jgi:hypothetical protein
MKYNQALLELKNNELTIANLKMKASNVSEEKPHEFPPEQFYIKNEPVIEEAGNTLEPYTENIEFEIKVEPEVKFEIKLDSESPVRTNKVLKLKGKFRNKNIEFVCDFCGLKNKRKDSLRKHILRMHSDFKNYQCNFCSMKFKLKVHLRRHNKTHTDADEFSFKCKFCENKFKTEDCLRLHKAVHKDIKHYQCDKCGKNFNTNQTLSPRET